MELNFKVSYKGYVGEKGAQWGEVSENSKTRYSLGNNFCVKCMKKKLEPYIVTEGLVSKKKCQKEFLMKSNVSKWFRVITLKLMQVFGSKNETKFF